MKIKNSRFVKITCSNVITWIVFASAICACAQTNKPATKSIEDLVQSGDSAISGSSNIPYVPGNIPRGIETLVQVHDEMKSIAAGVVGSDEVNQSAWRNRLDNLTSKLSEVEKNNTQLEFFKIIPNVIEFFPESDVERPNFALNAEGVLLNLSSILLYAMAQHIAENSSSVEPQLSRDFALIFSIPGFLSEPDWEDSPMPIDAAGVFILDSAVVVQHLKAQPWERAERFIGGWGSAEAFARYTGTGNGIPALKAKYAANQAAIVARWDDLAKWVEAQRPDDDE